MTLDSYGFGTSRHFQRGKFSMAHGQWHPTNPRAWADDVQETKRMSRLYIIRKIHASFRINFTDRSYNRYLSLIVPRTSVFSRNSNFTSIQHRYNRTTGLFSRLFWACSIEIILNMVCCGSSILEWLFYIWISYNRSLRVTFRVISAHCTPFFQPTINLFRLKSKFVRGIYYIRKFERPIVFAILK